MFWILKEFGKAGGQLHHPDAPNMPTQYNSFSAADYHRWMHYIFCINQILGSKPFKSNGVGITTNAVSASVHFVVPQQDDPDDELSMTDSIWQLALNDPQDADEQCDENDNGIGGEGKQNHLRKLLLFWI